MSKKSPKNPSKPVALKVAKRAAKPAAVKATRSASKPAAKSPVKKAAKPTKAPVSKKPPAAKPSAPKPARKAIAATIAAAKAEAHPKATAKLLTRASTKPATQASTKTAGKPKASLKTQPVPNKPAKPVAPAVAIEGAQAPAFQLPRDGGATVALSDYAGRKLVIFFYPRANTPGCTKEAIDFTRLSDDFDTAGTAILGVSADSQKAQESFRDKHDLTTPLLSDQTQEMLKSYGAWGEKSMYGKSFEGVLRTTVLIDGNGKVARIWRSVKVDGHADAVLEEARRI
jgi:peroxiredoxin Q/BCP